MASKVISALSVLSKWAASVVQSPWLQILGASYLVTMALGGVALVVFGYGCMQKRKEMEQQFKADLEEAPYIAHIRSYLGQSFKYPSAPSRILDHLYLGSESDALDLNNLRSLGISHVINCASGYISTGASFYGPGFNYMQFDAEDDHDYDIIQHYPQVFAFIEEARRSGGKAFIHCIMGINRSGALAAAYVMQTGQFGPITAVEQVHKARPCVLTNDGFQRQLVKFARQKELLHLDADKLKPTFDKQN